MAAKTDKEKAKDLELALAALQLRYDALFAEHNRLIAGVVELKLALNSILGYRSVEKTFNVKNRAEIMALATSALEKVS